MKPFKIGPACRLVNETQYWDSVEGKWKVHRYPKKQLIQNPPQKFDAEQMAFLKDYAALLVEKIKLDAEARRNQEAAIAEYFFWADVANV